MNFGERIDGFGVRMRTNEILENKFSKNKCMYKAQSGRLDNTVLASSRTKMEAHGVVQTQHKVAEGWPAKHKNGSPRGPSTHWWWWFGRRSTTAAAAMVNDMKKNRGVTGGRALRQSIG